jgi:hypothetical protein
LVSRAGEAKRQHVKSYPSRITCNRARALSSAFETLVGSRRNCVVWLWTIGVRRLLPRNCPPGRPFERCRDCLAAIP